MKLVSFAVVAAACWFPNAAMACFLPEGSIELQVATAADELAASSQSSRYQPFAISGEMLLIGGYEYFPYGLPRIIEPELLEFAAHYGQVPLFREAGVTEVLPEIFYFLYDGMTCEFQPYQIGEKVY
jgi:hypothetical protein